MQKLLFLFFLLISCSSVAAGSVATDGDDPIQFRPKKEDGNVGGPQDGISCPVLGVYMEDGVLIYGHTDGMIAVSAEDADGETLFDAIGNLDQGVFVALPDSHGYVKITVTYGDTTYIAEI